MKLSNESLNNWLDSLPDELSIRAAGNIAKRCLDENKEIYELYDESSQETFFEILSTIIEPDIDEEISDEYPTSYYTNQLINLGLPIELSNAIINLTNYVDKFGY